MSGLGEAWGRIDAKAGISLSVALEDSLEQCPDPAMALAHLERWLGAVGNPRVAAQQLTAIPLAASIFLKVLGSSSELGSCLVQNPELASLILDPSEVGRPVSAEKWLNQGTRLMESANSYTHKLDRLRFLKQEALIRISAADQGGVWNEEQAWEALSDLADALVQLALAAAWDDYRATRSLEGPCLLQAAGMGKLGGRELNYSSDIDLVYFVPDDADEADLKHATRLAEKLNRALSDRMGRGALFRVDMRLRPYGRSGDLVVRQRALEGYMARHAEPWEHMALIRSRVLVGTPEAKERWEAMRRAHAFERLRGEWQIEEILRMRSRLEDKSSDRDLKRAPGGIRDVEFTAQVMQLIHAASDPELQSAGTLQVLRRLAQRELIPSEAERDLAGGYRFLRKVEHQIQVEAGRQLHDIPEGREARAKLARRLGMSQLEEFDEKLAETRGRVRRWYQAILGSLQDLSPQDKALSRAGELAPKLNEWVSLLSDPESFWRSLDENESSLDRALQVLQRGPRLVEWLKHSDTVTEQVLSGEILEPPPAAPAVFEGRRLRTKWLRAAVREALGVTGAFSHEFGAACDLLLARLAEEHPGLTIAAMGSYSEGTLSLESDLDVVFLIADPATEKTAHSASARISDLRSQNSPVLLDLRLRPEGRQGPLGVSLPALKVYAGTRLEAWERLAVGRARLVAGSPAVFREFRSTVLGPRPTDDDRSALRHIKARVEQERAQKRPGFADIKLGPGGLDDIAWGLLWLGLHHLPTEADPRPSRIPDLAEWAHGAGYLASDEARLLPPLAAELAHVRVRLALLGQDDTLLPLEADKLEDRGVKPGLSERLAACREVVERLLSSC